MKHPKYPETELTRNILSDWSTGMYSRQSLAVKYRVSIRMIAGITSKKRQNFFVKEEYRKT